MKYILTITLAFLLAGCGERNHSSQLRNCEKMRLVSMAPNITEILYALELSNQVVGVSKYSAYPPEAAEKPSVGGIYDPNWERIVSLQPNLVIGLDSQEEIAAQLKALGIPFLGVSHEHISEIMESILTLGKACGAEAAAQKLFQGLEKQTADFSKPWKNPKPKVLVCVGHDEQMTRMYVAARGTFYDDLINLAGGTNACEQTAIKYPEISPEGLAAMNPDIVIDLVPTIGKNPVDFSKAWKPYQAVIITNDYAFIPGPRFGLLLEDFIEAIQPKDKSK